MSAERTFNIGGRTVKESEVPQIFNLSHLLKDYIDSINLHGTEITKREFEKMLRQQLSSFVQEQLIQPLSDRYLLKIELTPQGEIQVLDENYPIQPDVVERAKEGWEHANGKGKHGKVGGTRYHELFVRRYFLEYLQVKSLVYNHIAQDPLLSAAYIQSLAESTSPIQVTLSDKQLKEGFTSRWYALAMPANEVHKGGGSYFNVYRILAIPNQTGFEYLLETQGYFHKLTWNRQVTKLLNIDQTDDFNLEKFDEEQIMMRIIQLSAEKDQFESDKLLIRIGFSAGDYLLPLRILYARYKQNKQIQAIENSIETLLHILETERTLRSGAEQDKRLAIAFEAIGNPLLSGAHVPTDAILSSYTEHLLTGKGRDIYIQSLISSIPSIVNQVGEWTLCGFYSAGGFVKNGQSLTKGLHNFGGLDSDECIKKRCGGCGNTNIPDTATSCPHCNWVPGMTHGHQPKFLRTNTNGNKAGSNVNAKNQASNDKEKVEFIPTIHLSGGNSISFTESLMRRRPSVGISHLLNSA